MINKNNNKSGFTLIETMVVVVVFSVVMSLALIVFLGSVRSQRVALAQQKLVMETSYALNRIEEKMRGGETPTKNNFEDYINIEDGVIEVLKFEASDNNKTVLVETKIKIDEDEKRDITYTLQTTIINRNY